MKVNYRGIILLLGFRLTGLVFHLEVVGLRMPPPVHYFMLSFIVFLNNLLVE